MEIENLIDFLETKTMSATFSSRGLQYLSLRNDKGDRLIDLELHDKKRGQDPRKQNSLKMDPLEKQLLRETVNFLETGKHAMPLDLAAFTDFQQRVFEAVSGIEPGQITTYKGIAEILGKPGAAQAVGSAVAKNPVSYFLPTHRVLPQRGIGICRSGAGFLREKLLVHEGHDLSKLRGNYLCTRKKCSLE